MTFERFIFNRKLERVINDEVKEDPFLYVPTIEELHEMINKAWGEYDNRYYKYKAAKKGIEYAIEEYIEIDFPSFTY